MIIFYPGFNKKVFHTYRVSKGRPIFLKNPFVKTKFLWFFSEKFYTVIAQKRNRWLFQNSINHRDNRPKLFQQYFNDICQRPNRDTAWKRWKLRENKQIESGKKGKMCKRQEFIRPAQNSICQYAYNGQTK